MLLFFIYQLYHLITVIMEMKAAAAQAALDAVSQQADQLAATQAQGGRLLWRRRSK